MNLEIIGFWPDYDEHNSYAVIQVNSSSAIVSKLKSLKLRFIVDGEITEVWVEAGTAKKYISECGGFLQL